MSGWMAAREAARWSVGEVCHEGGLSCMVASCATCWFNVQLLIFRVGVQWYLDVRVVRWSVSHSLHRRIF